ncbi:MAG: RHS repeat protein [Planctomycetes bacterium]|nr:RHS repeat protein [Planctomycetota bacterium]
MRLWTHKEGASLPGAYTLTENSTAPRTVWEWETNQGVTRSAYATGTRHYTTDYFYDAHRRLSGVLDAGLNATHYDYDDWGNLLTVTDALTHVTVTGYDARNRLVLRRDALGNPTQWQYNAQGQVTEMIDALGRETDYVYDARGWQVTLLEAVGTDWERVAFLDYDAAGNLDRLERPRAYLDGHGLEGTDEPGSVVTTYEYDAVNRRIGRTEGFGTGLARTTLWDYDEAGELLWESRPLHYDDEEVPLGAAAEVVTSYGYDRLGRRNLVTEADGDRDLRRSTRYEYDKLGNVQWEIDPLGRKTYHEAATTRWDGCTGRPTR